MPPRKKRARRTSKTPPRTTRASGYPWRRILLLSLLLLVLSSILYVIYLDLQVRRQFEGKRWAIPARVYARPLELYQGRPLSVAQLERSLALLRYRVEANAKTAGSYVREGNRFLIHSRAFQFWDGQEPKRVIEVVLGDEAVASLRQVSGGIPLDLVRLEPMHIGGIYPQHKEDRVLIQLAQAPSNLLAALLVIEDRRFYEHHGVDPRAIARALWRNLRAGKTVQGGSTLTQQLVKNFYLSNERTLWRKGNEAIMSVLLDFHYAKNEILEAYLNEIYLGQDEGRAIHGFGLASQFYFGKDIEKLQLHEMATLVALIRGPNYYHPKRQPQRLLARRNLILEKLAEEKIIQPWQARHARQQGLGLQHYASQDASHYPAFIELVRRQLRSEYAKEDLQSEGLRIFTTLDPWIQDRAENALQSTVQQLGPRLKNNLNLQGAILVSSTTDGEVYAVVADRQPRFTGFNRALDAVRPIGSLIKPAVYLTALSQKDRYHPASILNDEPIRLLGPDKKTWSPENYDRQAHGKVPLFEALTQSYNLATVQLGMELGFEPIQKTLQRLGIQRPIPPYPSMLLGAVGMSPLEVMQMYHTYATGGFQSPLRSIQSVMTSEGKPLQHFPLQVKQTIDAALIHQLNTILRRVVTHGTAKSLPQWLGRDTVIAGKTGTTNDLRDSWFAGFSGSHLAVVWMGNDQNQSTGLTGSQGAMRVWANLFKAIDTQDLLLDEMPGLEYQDIDHHNGLRADRYCERAVRLPFFPGQAPRAVSACR
ncbi:MAG: penicillin-binding protein 1B [Gammaproteobacteria bacterium]